MRHQPEKIFSGGQGWSIGWSDCAKSPQHGHGDEDISCGTKSVAESEQKMMRKLRNEFSDLCLRSSNVDKLRDGVNVHCGDDHASQDSLRPSIGN